MAKELPYYQYEVAEYLAGDIMICSLEAQGLFAIIKCLYWQKECELTVKKVLKRYDRADLISELADEKCIKVDKDGNIEVTFLLRQHGIFKARREKLSEAGKRGGQSKKKATLKPPLSEDKATPKHLEEIRLEKSREEDKKKFNFRLSLLDYGFKEQLVNDWLLVRKKKSATNSETAYTKFINQVEKSTLSKDQILEVCIEKDWKAFNHAWKVDNKTTAVPFMDNGINSEQDYKDLYEK